MKFFVAIINPLRFYTKPYQLRELPIKIKWFATAFHQCRAFYFRRFTEVL